MNTTNSTLLLFHVVFLALDILAVQVPGPVRQFLLPFFCQRVHKGSQAQGWAASAFVYTNEGQIV